MYSGLRSKNLKCGDVNDMAKQDIAPVSPTQLFGIHPRTKVTMGVVRPSAMCLGPREKSCSPVHRVTGIQTLFLAVGPAVACEVAAAPLNMVWEKLENSLRQSPTGESTLVAQNIVYLGECSM